MLCSSGSGNAASEICAGRINVLLELAAFAAAASGKTLFNGALLHWIVGLYVCHVLKVYTKFSTLVVFVLPSPLHFSPPLIYAPSPLHNAQGRRSPLLFPAAHPSSSTP